MVRFLIGVLLLVLAAPVFAETPYEAYDRAYTANANCYDARCVAETALYDAAAVRDYAAAARTAAVAQGATAAELLAGDALLAGGDECAQFAVADFWQGHGWKDAAEPHWLTGLILFWTGYIPEGLAEFAISTPGYEEAIRNYTRSAVWFGKARDDFQNAEYAFWTAYYLCQPDA